MYASSPDRGMHLLLESYPAIKKRVPEVCLDIYYNWKKFYDAVKNDNAEWSYRARYCNEMLARLKNANVQHHGSISKLELLKKMHTTRLLAYPCNPVSFTEGFSVTTLEAACAGCVPVITDADALGEIYSDNVPMIRMPYDRNAYADLVVELLLNNKEYAKCQAKARHLLKEYTWIKLAKVLAEEF